MRGANRSEFDANLALACTPQPRNAVRPTAVKRTRREERWQASDNHGLMAWVLGLFG